MSLCYSTVSGLGHCLPERRVSNSELAAMVGRSAGILAKPNGIPVRRFAPEGVGPSELAFEAALGALRQAKKSAGEVEFIVFATMSPDFVFPGGGCLLQDKLGCGTIGALDVRAQCTGFLQGLLVADQFIASGTYRNALVAGSEVLSSYIDPGEPGIEAVGCFGDSAGAIFLAVGEAPPSVPLTVVVHTDASELESFWCEFPASRNFPMRVTPEHLRTNRHLPQIKSGRVIDRALAELPGTITAAVAKSGTTVRRIDRLLVQVLDPAAATEIGRAAGFALEQIVAVGKETGTIGAAPLPAALSLMRENGNLKRGSVVCLASFGAGLNWGAAVLEL